MIALLPPLVPLYVKVHLVPSEQRAAVMMCDPCPCPAVSLLCDLQQSLSLSRAIHKLSFIRVLRTLPHARLRLGLEQHDPVPPLCRRSWPHRDRLGEGFGLSLFPQQESPLASSGSGAWAQGDGGGGPGRSPSPA